MSLTYLDPLMIKQPTGINNLSAVNLIANNATINSLSAINSYTNKIINDTSVFGNLTVTGSITALSGINFVQTLTTTTSSLSIVNVGNQIGLYVSQSPSVAPVASFVGNNTELLRVNNISPDTGKPVVIIAKSPTGLSLSADGTSNFKTTNIDIANIDIANIDTLNTSIYSVASLTSTNLYINKGIYLPTAGGSVYNNAAFFGNLTVFGSISALSGITTTNTFTNQTSSLSVVNTGTGPALYVSQLQHPNGIAIFSESNGNTILKINNSGYNLPAITVNGTISATSGTSNQWQTAYNVATEYQIASGTFVKNAAFNSYKTDVSNTTATFVNNAAFNSYKTDVSNVSGNWQTAYTWVSTNLANATFTSSVSAPSLSGTHYGDGSKLSGISTTLPSDIASDTAVGAITAGQVIAAGTTFQQFVQTLLSQVYYPTFSVPTASLGSSIGSVVESGTTGITLTVTLNRGSIVGKTVNGIWQSGTTQDYRSGAATLYIINGTNNGTNNALTSSAAIINDGTNSFTSSVTYGTGPQPVDSKGNNYSTPLASGSLTPSVNVTGARKYFYGTSASAVTNSAQVRALGSSTLNPSNGTTFTINIPSGAAYVIFAYPSTLRDVNSVKYVEGLNAEVKDVFTQTTVSVLGLNSYPGVNYKVYTYQPASPFSTTATYNVTI